VLACGRVSITSDTIDGEPALGGAGNTSKQSGHPGAPDYGAEYYGDYARVGYDHSEQWLTFFGRMADRLIEDIQPKSSLDAGCAIGLLVEALRDRGVAAEGIDVSEFALDKAREDVKPFLRVASITDPLPRHYDLITCIEVIEHLAAPDAERAIANICEHTDDVVLSSTPLNYRDPTHTNVHPPEYWTERFARQGFIRDVDFDGSFIAPWAARYQRSTAPLHRVVAGYDRVYARMSYELQERNGVVQEQLQQIGDLQERLRHAHDRERLAVQLARRMDDLALKAAPPGTLRRRLLQRVIRAVDRTDQRLPPA
jgi:SAM-dependent methyltransferase